MKGHGRPQWTSKIAPARLTQIALAVESERETVRQIYVRLNLQAFTRYGTFRRWVTEQHRLIARRESNTPPAAGDAPCFRPAWGTRGIARLRKLGLAALGRPEASAVTLVSLLDAADSLRIVADRLVDVAGLFRPCQVGQSATNSARATDGHSGADREVGNAVVRDGDDFRGGEGGRVGAE
jgi:hypothetical protein